MTPNQFRRIALGMNGSVAGSHMDHPDFRANGRIFATLHHDRAWGMVALTPEQQEGFMRDEPAAFKPEPGAWGRQGCTAVRLDAVDEETLGEALTLAWRNAIEKAAVRGTRKRAARTVKRKATGRSRTR